MRNILLFLSKLPGQMAAGPCPLQIVAAAIAVNIENFTTSIKPRHHPGGHGLRIKIGGINTTQGHLRFTKGSRTQNIDAPCTQFIGKAFQRFVIQGALRFDANGLECALRKQAWQKSHKERFGTAYWMRSQTSAE